MARQQATQAPKKRKVSTTLLWGLLGLVILTAGVVSALYYMNRERIESDARLTVIKDFVAKVDEAIEKGKSALDITLEKGKSAADVVGQKLAGLKPDSIKLPGLSGGTRRYRVKEGENLWAIARESNLVDNPWEWRTILIQNKDKIEWAFINEEEQAWKVMLATGQELTVRRDAQPDMGEPQGKKFAFQLASMNEAQLKRAEFVVRVLMKDGYYAYLYRHEKDGRNWYRIRSGFYDSEARARAIGNEIKAHYTKQNYFPDDLWVMTPSPAEMRGENLVFGAQLINPWVVELSDRDTHGDAVKDLRRVGSVGEFAYIWQTRNSITKRYIYRVRIGFFASDADARKLFSGKSGALWKDAKTVKLHQLEETLPGQNLKLDGVNS